METEEVIDKSPMENQVSARRAWPGGEAEGNLDKRARVALPRTWPSMRRMWRWQPIDSGDEESKPLTEEERAQGR